MQIHSQMQKKATGIRPIRGPGRPGASFLRNADNQTQHAELGRSVRLSLIAPFDEAQDATFVPGLKLFSKDDAPAGWPGELQEFPAG